LRKSVLKSGAIGRTDCVVPSLRLVDPCGQKLSIWNYKQRTASAWMNDWFAAYLIEKCIAG